MKVDVQKEFCKAFEQLIYYYDRWRIWDDFIKMAALAIANKVKTEDWEKREREYLTTLNFYQKGEREIFPKLLGLLAMALSKNPNQDFLGEVYMLLNLGQKDKGQYFTPYGVASLMAMLTCNGIEKRVMDEGYVSVSDPACGSGSMLIAFANEVQNKGINPQTDILFIGQDISYTAAMMCYIQLSLLSLPGYVIVGDKLLKPGIHPDNQVWYTPAFYLNAGNIVEKLNTQQEKCGQGLLIDSAESSIHCKGDEEKLSA